MKQSIKTPLEIKDMDRKSAIGRYAFFKEYGYNGAKSLLAQRQLFIDNLLIEKDIAEVINSAAKDFILTVHSLAK